MSDSITVPMIFTNAEILRAKGWTYLYHITRPENYEKMKEDPFLYTPAERHQKRVEVEGVLSIEHIDFETSYYEVSTGGFPGIYLSLTHKSLDELRKRAGEKGCLLIFPLELMNQKNWHLNLQDRNGYFYSDTITSDEVYAIPRAVTLVEARGIENEVVFHDRISLSNLVDVLGMPVSWRPSAPIGLELDLETLPCYIYYSGRSYSGFKYPFLRATLEYRACFQEGDEEPPLREDTTSSEFFFAWLMKYLPRESSSDLYEGMSLKEMDEYLRDTIHPESGMNLVNHFFYHRLSPKY